MCIRTPDGYKLKTGKVIPFHNPDLTNLTPEEFTDLATEKASLLEMISVRDSQSKLKDQLDTVSSDVKNILKII